MSASVLWNERYAAMAVETPPSKLHLHARGKPVLCHLRLREAKSQDFGQLVPASHLILIVESRYVKVMWTSSVRLESMPFRLQEVFALEKPKNARMSYVALGGIGGSNEGALEYVRTSDGLRRYTVSTEGQNS
ncbi:hypothetical protein M7I_4625 [Glarea lozoyensis 74030]|uniref:Uncharacterized protein n=1 Tax=Glarea lozoyensis (strain ATCC 74030 / MF5533) TaxID=1104152 RepID=H0EPP0_GLAL7|nr:hypothetical protein M7I_4625 [Glarea lozoyensis 74030]